MKKIMLSGIFVILLTASVSIVSSAYFTDNETSSDNTFVAGAIDLKVSNDSYYNGVVSGSLSWESGDLDDQLFFNYVDMMPGDWGESTIDLRVDGNDSWVCMNLEIDSTLENGVTEPEGEVDETDGENEGELQEYIQMIFWADDGDNVLEDSETGSVFVESMSLKQLSDLNHITLVDSEVNIWGDEGAFVGGQEIKYLGNAWCFGTLSMEAVADGDNSPEIDPGVGCGALGMSNISQTDGVSMSLSFDTIQAKNNTDFLCNNLNN